MWENLIVKPSSVCERLFLPAWMKETFYVSRKIPQIKYMTVYLFFVNLQLPLHQCKELITIRSISPKQSICTTN
jgi:hypothetical protein